MAGRIVIRGARVHNLKSIDLEIPRDSFVVITGVSGSGKSSLAFDTLYAEGQRRYLESLAADARQFVRQLERPDVDSIDGLSPAIAIQQRGGALGARSTVGTITEIYDYLRLLFARVGTTTCTGCAGEVVVYSTARIVDELRTRYPARRAMILAPVTLPAEHPRERIADLVRAGFTRVKVGAHLEELTVIGDLDAVGFNPLQIVIDRLALHADAEKRLADSLELAGRLGAGILKVEISDGPGDEPNQAIFSIRPVCPSCGRPVPELTPALFSFNSVQGACPVCEGSGVSSDRKLEGSPDAGIEERPCSSCDGQRLSAESLSVKLAGKNIAEVAALPAKDALAFFANVNLAGAERTVGQKIIEVVVDRLRFLTEAGLEYLSLDRRSATLSSGEAQRVRLTTQLGSNLSGVLYILDEPTVGLHQRDNERLLRLLRQLQARGNSLVVVEHDEDTISQADHVIDMGPGAGLEGGMVVAQGTPRELLASDASLTGRYLSGRAVIPVPARRRSGSGAMTVHGARTHNLRGIDVSIPLGAMTCVTGVSGSGKTSLVLDTLYRGTAELLRRPPAAGGRPAVLTGWEQFQRVVAVEQTPIGRTPKSIPATYIGILDELRELFARLPEARVRGYKAARFSFNNPGGRCEGCSGDGVVRIDMYFLPDTFVTCDVCGGKRYNRETLEIKYKGLSIADVLQLNVRRALDLLNTVPGLETRLRTLQDVGLGYLRLGQRAATLSGGEAQRIKLARELARRATGATLYILDEPTTGLHFEDVRKLLDLLHRLIDLGNTVVIVEHNLDVIKTADYIIDLGPEAGSGGGQVVAQGTPEEIARVEASFTGRYLRQKLQPLPASPIGR